jgi:chloramphenicol O-acetyltransferase type A
MSGRFLDVEGWSRRDAFRFFMAYEQPFFNVCAEVELGPTLAWCRARGASSSLACWYVCLLAINAVEPMRYRLRGDQVWVHDQLSVATTVLNEDETFRFCYLPYADSFAAFCASAQAAMASEEAPMDGRPEEDALIHGSTLPWLRFTSVAHARRIGPAADSTPKVVFGRYTKRPDGGASVPVSIEVHHALMDGLHVARVFEALEQRFMEPERWLRT